MLVPEMATAQHRSWAFLHELLRSHLDATGSTVNATDRLDNLGREWLTVPLTDALFLQLC